MEDKIKLIVSQLGDDRVKTKIDITQHLESGLGGIVEGFFIATSTRELINVIELCRELKLNYFIIGSGSKVALTNGANLGLVIKNRSSSLKIFGIKGKVSTKGIGVEEALIEADSGVSLHQLSEFAQSQNLVGLEVLKNGVGTIGGSLMMNQEIREKIHQVKVLNKVSDILTKKIEEVSKDDVILSVVLKLKSSK